MPSPFPGMDPYLEDPLISEDFHSDLASEIRAQLTPKLKPRYYVALVPRVLYEEVVIESTRGSLKPDVSVIRAGGEPSIGDGHAAAIDPAPLIGTVAQSVPVKAVSLEIRQVGTGVLVTAVEILSPVNKRSGHEAHDEYVKKRRRLMRSAVSLLEIDLLRRGARFPTREALPEEPWFVFLHRGRSSARVEIWPLPFNERIPEIPVPLLDPDPDESLDLGAAIAAVYERAAYELRIDYGGPPPKPELPEDVAAWLARRKS